MKIKQRLINSRKDVPTGFISAREVLRLHGDTVYNLALNAARVGSFDSVKVMTTPTDKRGPVFFDPSWKKHIPAEVFTPIKPEPAKIESIKLTVQDVVKAISVPENGTIDLALQQKIIQNQEVTNSVLLRIEAALLRQEKIWSTAS